MALVQPKKASIYPSNAWSAKGVFAARSSRTTRGERPCTCPMQAGTRVQPNAAIDVGPDDAVWKSFGPGNIEKVSLAFTAILTRPNHPP